MLHKESFSNRLLTSYQMSRKLRKSSTLNYKKFSARLQDMSNTTKIGELL